MTTDDLPVKAAAEIRGHRYRAVFISDLHLGSRGCKADCLLDFLHHVESEINVVRGEMSIVGARPIRRHFADQLAAHVPFYDIRFAQKPGLTGWAQIKHSYSSTFAEQIEKFYYDYYYIRNYSIWLDLHIIILTFGEIIRLKGT